MCIFSGFPAGGWISGVREMKAGKPPGATEIVIVQYNTKIQFAHFIGSVRAGEILEIWCVTEVITKNNILYVYNIIII